MLNGPDPRVGGGPVRGPLGYISVGLRLIEFVFGNRFRIGGIESGGLIEAQVGLGWGPGRRQWRGSGGESEMREDGVNGNGIGDEGDDTHGFPATASRGARAHEREDLIDASDKRGPSRGSTAAWGGSVRRTRGGLSAKLP